jgi:hypothetical protein
MTIFLISIMCLSIGSLELVASRTTPFSLQQANLDNQTSTFIAKAQQIIDRIVGGNVVSSMKR